MNLSLPKAWPALAPLALLLGCGGAARNPEPQDPGIGGPVSTFDPTAPNPGDDRPPTAPRIQWEGTGAKGQYLPNRVWVLAPTQGVGLRPRHTAHARLVVPAGRRDGPKNIAELTALEIVHTGDPTTGRPPLMEVVRAAGGTLSVQVEDHTTTFELMAPTNRAPALLDDLFAAAALPTRGRSQLETARENTRRELVQAVRRNDHREEVHWLLTGGEPRTASEQVQALLEPDPTQVLAFHETHYVPEGSALTVWFPGAPVDAALARASTAASRWPLKGRRASKPGAVRPPDPLAVWFTDGQGATTFSALVPLPNPASATWAAETVALDAAVPGGLGGRLEREVQQAGLEDLLPLQLERRHVGIRRVLELRSRGTPAQMELLARCVARAVDSLQVAPPSPSELALALRRARLDLARLNSSPGAWSSVALSRIWSAKLGDPLKQHRRLLENPDKLGLEQVVSAVAITPLRFVFTGGEPPQSTRLNLERRERSTMDAPELQLEMPEAAMGEAVQPILDRAFAATGGKGRLARLPGILWQATTTAADAPMLVETMRSVGDQQMWWQRFVLGSAVLTQVEGEQGQLTVAGSKRPMSKDEVRRAQMALRRHPIVVLGRLARGDSNARVLAERVLDGAELTVLELKDPAFDRLLLYVDDASGLVRVVESWQEVPGESTIYRRERWSDYRSVDGMRVPHLLDAEFQEGGAPARTVYEDVAIRAATSAELTQPPAAPK